jgi:hypothetical protein
MVSAIGFEPMSFDFQGRRERPDFPTRCLTTAFSRWTVDANVEGRGSWKRACHSHAVVAREFQHGNSPRSFVVQFPLILTGTRLCAGSPMVGGTRFRNGAVMGSSPSRRTIFAFPSRRRSVKPMTMKQTGGGREVQVLGNAPWPA